MLVPDPTTRTNSKATLDLPWWVNPIWPATIVFSIAVFFAYRGGVQQYDVWNSTKYVDKHFVFLMIYGFTAFIAGIMIASTFALSVSLRNDRGDGERPQVELDETDVRLFDRFAHAMFLLTMLGYFAWVMFSLSRGGSISAVIDVFMFQDGAISRLKDVSAPVAGVTTLTQLAPLAVTLRFLLRRLGSEQRRYEITIIVILSAFRAFLYAERLAIIEILVPLLIVSVVVPGREQHRVRSRLLPVLSIPSLWGVFAIFEYTRSWSYYSRISDISFIDYITQRLLGYYVTSVNNSALYHRVSSGVDHDIFYPFPALWNAPIIGSILGAPQIESMRMGTWWALILKSFGNPEFNNVGTFLVTDADFGTLVSVAYWFILGAVLGLMYAGVRRASIPAIVALSCSFVGVLEIVRIIYWTSGRFTPTIGGIVLLMVLSSLQHRPEHVPQRNPIGQLRPPALQRGHAEQSITS
ncbi:hypothetical protein BH09CHL1_BH09CHL1_11310 [soil metagenome]